MEMLGHRHLPITQQQAWEALNDAETLKKCIPGCDKFELVGDNTPTHPDVTTERERLVLQRDEYLPQP